MIASLDQGRYHQPMAQKAEQTLLCILYYVHFYLNMTKFWAIRPMVTLPNVQTKVQKLNKDSSLSEMWCQLFTYSILWESVQGVSAIHSGDPTVLGRRKEIQNWVVCSVCFSVPYFVKPLTPIGHFLLEMLGPFGFPYWFFSSVLALIWWKSWLQIMLYDHLWNPIEVSPEESPQASESSWNHSSASGAQFHRTEM